MYLTDLKPGQKARLVKAIGQQEEVQRLQELGLIEGACVEMVRTLYRKQRLQIEVRHTSICLTKEHADCFWVEAL